MWAGRGRWLILLVGAALALRLALFWSYVNTASDDQQYSALARELAHEQRFAFGPSPAPLTYARLPGYPLFLRYIVDANNPGRLPRLQKAVRINQALDVATAAGVALLALLLDLSGVALWAGALVVLSPSMMFRSSYALSETLATCLGAFEVLLAVWAWRALSRSRLFASGLVAGVAQLVRLDALTALPAVALWLVAPVSRRIKATGAALFVVGFLLTFAAWPLRNLIQFGAPHPEATEWLDQAGNVLPTGALAWMRTWCAGKPGEAWSNLMIVNHGPLEIVRPGVVLPVMYDSPAERNQVVALFDRYNRERLTPAVDQAFAALARQRIVAHPLKVLVLLPLERMLQLWLPQGGIVVGPRWAPVVNFAEGVLLPLLALGGVALLARRKQWAALWVLLSPIAARMLLHSFATPFPDARYFAEAMPFVLLLAATSLHAGASYGWARIRAPKEKI